MKVLSDIPFDFYGSTFLMYYCEDGRLYIPLYRLCETISIETYAQIKRIKEDEAAEGEWITLNIETEYQDSTRSRDVTCINIEYLPLWLGGISTKRVREDVRPKLIMFKKELRDSAWATFRSRILPDDIRAEMDARLPQDVQAYYKAMDEAQELRRYIKKVEDQVNALEARLSEKMFINLAQALRIRDMVVIMAEAASQKSKGRTMGQWTGFIYDDLYHEFDVTSYKLIPESQYRAACDLLVNRWTMFVPGEPLPESFKFIDQKGLF